MPNQPNRLKCSAAPTRCLKYKQEGAVLLKSELDAAGQTSRRKGNEGEGREQGGNCVAGLVKTSSLRPEMPLSSVLSQNGISMTD